MSSLFSVPTHTDPKFCEGVVTEIDPIRLFCKVKTSKGQNLIEVAWMMPSGGSSRSGTLFMPIIGDRVVVNTSLGYPVIMGYLPKISTGEKFPTNIDTGTPEVDTGDFSPLANELSVFGEKTGDAVVGDHIITSEGGGLLGVLRGGSIIAKASRLAQIFITKFDDLVRIVARNYELFTDAFIDVSANARGRIYRFIGYTDTAANSMSDTYFYHEYYGDTALAEALQTEYLDADENSFPPSNSTIQKVQVLNATADPLYMRTIDLDGTAVQKVQNNQATTVTTFKHDLNTLVLKYNDQVIITVSSANAVIEFDNGGKVVVSADGVDCTFQTHFMTMDATGVHLG